MTTNEIPMSWDYAKNLIGMCLSKSTLNKYRLFKNQVISNNDSVVNYIIKNRLNWIKFSKDNQLIIDLKPSGTKLFENINDFKIIGNDFPYNFENNITHVVVWSKISIPSDPNSKIGDVSLYTKRIIEKYIDKTFIKHFGIQSKNLLWFRNYPILQSVTELSHIHILIRDLDEFKIDEIIGNSGLPLEDDDY
ncbi:hypothetical protein WICMUC_003015 [Wickerhamomyces mucosus]|uniref:N-acetylglucosamine-induced protein 1 n=1 Tax=Wickerhamomyces mucosus TaxID=1378264 RepID=A0A9P8PMX2_9ASCO|nr:hypothetical protein WICMUC_003015 [Wickerhamomyces mucosus]